MCLFVYHYFSCGQHRLNLEVGLGLGYQPASSLYSFRSILLGVKKNVARET